MESSPSCRRKNTGQCAGQRMKARRGRGGVGPIRQDLQATVSTVAFTLGEAGRPGAL